jgi:hypothetical protein
MDNFQISHEFSASELGAATGWPPSVIDDYITLVNNFKALAAMFTDVPATSTSKGTKGQTAYDNNFLYKCVQTDVWHRAELKAY